MASKPTDYRAFLGAKQSYVSIRGEKLRTRRRSGHVEIVRDHKTGQWVRHVYALEGGRG
jgi:hypothetical protein